MKFLTATARSLTAGVLMALAGAAAAQQAYPNKPIRVLIPYAAGGTTDIYARLVSQKLTERWGQQLIVDNRPGGNGVIACEALLKMPADGYTVMAMTQDHVMVPHLLRMTTPYHAIKDFAPVATVSLSQMMLAVHPSVPANNLKEFIALAKSKPGKLNYASAGNGTIAHLTTEMFNVVAGVKMLHIPYKGGAPAMADLLSGQVQVNFVTPLAAVAHIKAGRLKGLAISGETRLPALPKVPTFSEAGLPTFGVKSWSGILAPAGTPRAIIDKFSTEIASILAIPEVREKLVSQGSDRFISTPDQFATLLNADMAMYGQVIKAMNIKFEN